MTVELHLPYPPSANRLWRIARHGAHKSSEYTRWLRDAGWAAKSQKPGAVKGPYRLQIQAVRPDRRKRDLDNLAKPISDLLMTIGVIDDDSNCEVLSMRWVTTGDGIHVLVAPASLEAT